MAEIFQKLQRALAHKGLVGTLDALWSRLCAALGRFRLAFAIGRLRNLWRLPALRRRHRGGTLNLGCGPDRRPDWLNADLGLTGDLHLDATRRFPFPDNWFASVFSEHMLEHLSEAGAATCLGECHRVLQPGGILRLSTPDLGYLIGRYLDRGQAGLAFRQATADASPWKYPPQMLPTPAQAVNDGFYLWEHRHLYDAEDLSRLLAATGFTAIVVRQAGQAGEPATGPESRTEGSLVAEARKPELV